AGVGAALVRSPAHATPAEKVLEFRVTVTDHFHLTSTGTARATLLPAPAPHVHKFSLERTVNGRTSGYRTGTASWDTKANTITVELDHEAGIIDAIDKEIGGDKLHFVLDLKDPVQTRFEGSWKGH